MQYFTFLQADEFARSGASRESKTRVNWQNRSEAKDGAIKVRELDGHMVDVSRCKCSL